MWSLVHADWAIAVTSIEINDRQNFDVPLKTAFGQLVAKEEHCFTPRRAEKEPRLTIFIHMHHIMRYPADSSIFMEFFSVIHVCIWYDNVFFNPYVNYCHPLGIKRHLLDSLTTDRRHDTIHQLRYEQIKGIYHRGQRDTWSFSLCCSITGNSGKCDGLSPGSALLELTLIVFLF